MFPADGGVNPALHRKHLAETSHGLKQRPGRPHIPSQRPPALLEGKMIRWIVLSGEGHCASAMAGTTRVCASGNPSSVSFRGLSSAGRAPDLHSGGHRFDPDRLHQIRSGFGVAHRLLELTICLLQIERLHQRVVGKAQNRQKLGSVAQVVRAHA